MSTDPSPIRTRLDGLGITSLALGFFGLLLFWLVPVAVVVSAAGVVIGLLGWLRAVGRSDRDYRFSVSGTLLSFAALVLNVLMLTGGFAAWTTTPRGGEGTPGGPAYEGTR